jgi:hypothetical protein
VAFAKGNIPWNKGKSLPKDVRDKISQSKQGSTGPNLGRKFSEESCQKMSIAQKGNKNAKGHHVSDEVKQIISNTNKGNKTKLGRRHTDEARRKMSESHKGKPAPMKGRKLSDERRKQISETRKGRAPWNKGKQGVYSEDTLHVMSELKRGDRAPNWRGGKSFEPYCPKFNCALKEEIRDRYDRRCLLCGLTENGEKLHVHHCDYNKMQGCGKRAWNLVPLCHSCHNKTNHKRWYWFLLLYNHWAQDPEINFEGETYASIS